MLNICNGCSGHSMIIISHSYFTQIYYKNKVCDKILNYYSYGFDYDYQIDSNIYMDDDDYISDYEDNYDDQPD